MGSSNPYKMVVSKDIDGYGLTASLCSERGRGGGGGGGCARLFEIRFNGLLAIAALLVAVPISSSTLARGQDSIGSPSLNV